MHAIACKKKQARKPASLHNTSALCWALQLALDYCYFVSIYQYSIIMQSVCSTSKDAGGFALPAVATCPFCGRSHWAGRTMIISRKFGSIHQLLLTTMHGEQPLTSSTACGMWRCSAFEACMHCSGAGNRWLHEELVTLLCHFSVQGKTLYLTQSNPLYGKVQLTLYLLVNSE